MNAALLRECPGLTEDAVAHRYDHAIEVQLPFLQVLRPDFRFSAICVRTLDYEALASLGHAVARVAGTSEESLLQVVSSDMTHYVSAGEAARQDRLALACIEALDPRGLYETVIGNDITMCGFAPAVVALTACLDLGATAGRTLRYTNSGEASGDLEHVVGYAGVVIR
jgi:AmmeMemoRadiSam system protein B